MAHDALAAPATGREILTIDDAPAISRPLATFIGATHGAVHEVLDVPDRGYRAIARLSGHLAAMWRTVYPSAASQPGGGGPLRAACLRRAREVEWTLRHLECQLSGEVAAASGRRRPPARHWPGSSAATRPPNRPWSAGWRTSSTPGTRRSWPGNTGAPWAARPPGRTRGARVPGRCAGPRSGCTAAGTGSSTPWTHGPAWATTTGWPSRSHPAPGRRPPARRPRGRDVSPAPVPGQLRYRRAPA